MICCENVVKILWMLHFFFNSSLDFSNHFFFPSHFRQLGYHNSYFLSPQFPTISATWLPQLVNHSGTRALHGQRMGSGMNFGNIITEIHFFSLPITSLNFLRSHTFLTILATVLPKFGISPHFAK